MIPAAFDYVAPKSVDGVVKALSSDADEIKILAGGQSLIPVLRLRLAAPTLLVDLRRIPELTGITEHANALTIGAMTTTAEIARSPLIRQHAAVLASAAHAVADPQVRHRGTLGGALVHADPAGDLPAPVLALDAEFIVAGPQGERVVRAADFFQDMFTTAVSEDELLTTIRVPKHTGWAAQYEKFNRVAQQWAIVAVAATVQVANGVVAEAKVALTNMGLTPLRATEVERALAGQAATVGLVRQAAERADASTHPPVDGNGDVAYRRSLARVLTRRALAKALGLDDN